jgi:mRNA-degrading endonuclease RelE of RelBE toxin-antitoxin system
MALFYKPAFKKFVKKQPRPLQLAIEDEVEVVGRDPGIGEGKKGDLAGFRVHKFKFRGQQYLIAYKIQGKDMVFYMTDTHENFYRELKRYVKEAGG